MKISLNWLRELVELPAERGCRTGGGGPDRAGAGGRGHRGARGASSGAWWWPRCWPCVRTRMPTSCASCACAPARREEDVVCGAPNVPPPGNKVCWAPPGARLPGGRTLDAREVRGVLSPGMLCSEPEMGLGEDGERHRRSCRTTAVPGEDVAKLLGALDDVFEVNVTPNRPDALSHIGIARELAALLRREPALAGHRSGTRAGARGGQRPHDGRRDRATPRGARATPPGSSPA